MQYILDNYNYTRYTLYSHSCM